MRDYKLKITVSAEQAKVLRQFTAKTVGRHAMLYEPKSGVTLQEGTVYAPFGRDCTRLQRFLDAGAATLVEGKISDGDAVITDVSIENGELVITFSDPVYLIEEIAIEDFVGIEKEEDHGISLESETTADLIATTVSTFDFPNFTASNDVAGTVVLTEDVAGEETLAVATVTGTGTLAANTVTQAVAGHVDFVLNGDFIDGDTITVAGKTITFYTDVTTAGTIALTLNEDFVAGDAIEVAGETVTFYTNPATAGVINITLNELFEVGDTITVAGETVTFYATEAAKGTDTHGVVLETANTATLQATAIFGMTFTGFNVTNPEAKQVRFTETVAGAETIEEAVVVSAFGDLTVNSAVPNVGAGDTFGVSLAAAADATAQATAIAALTFTGYTVTNPGAKQVLFTEDVAGAQDCLAAVVGGTGTLAVNVGTPNEGANDADGIDLNTAATEILQATAIAALDFTAVYAATNLEAGKVVITQATAGTGTIAEAVKAGTGTFASNVATQAVAGYNTLTFNNDFVAEDTIEVCGKTINFYEDDADLAAALVPVELTTENIDPDEENDFTTEKTFDIITGGLPSGFVYITFYSALGSFEDENGNTVALDPTIYTVDLS